MTVGRVGGELVEAGVTGLAAGRMGGVLTEAAVTALALGRTGGVLVEVGVVGSNIILADGTLPVFRK